MAVDNFLIDKNKQLALLILSLFGLFAGFMLVGYRQLVRKKAEYDQVDLLISPENMTLQVGESQTVNVYLNLGNLKTVYASAEISYPKEIISIESIQYDPDNEFDVVIDEITGVDNNQGKIKIGLRSLSPVVDNIRIAALQLRADNLGEGSLQFDQTSVSNYENSTWLSVNPVSAQVSVDSGENTPAPTNTLPPTNTPVETSPTVSPTDTPLPTNTPLEATHTVTPTVLPTDTPLPTNTSAPTNTHQPTRTPSPTVASQPTDTPFPTSHPTSESAVVGMEIKLSGTEYMVGGQEKVVENIPSLNFNVTFKADEYYYREEDVVFEFDENAVGRGVVEVPNLLEDKDYVVLIKGPVHLSNRYCRDDQDGYCWPDEGRISLNPGKNILDFTKWPLEPGDINRDGVINVVDFSLLKQALGEKDSSKGDMNFNGTVNTQDISFFLDTLSRRYEDQT